MPTETIGRYEVEGMIGRGAMAIVYKAIDPTIGRTVALKTMRFDVSGIDQNEVLARFRNEARAAGKLLHPNLVTIYDAGEQSGTFYIAMECVEGATLQAVLHEHRFLPLDRVVDIMAQICSGLDYAHANGVVHRDIKPANIMLTGSGVIKIMDFGIAKSGAQLNTGGNVLGTPNYISPEMVKGDRVDGRSDLFSVAVILHEMLLGERPFLAPNISTIIYKIVNEPLSADLETRVHPAMAGILRKALSKHPSDRYQTGADLVNALKTYQALLAEPVSQPVFPGTPIAPSWSNEAAAVTPKRAEAPKVSAPPSKGYVAPEVFGSDVPEKFRAVRPEAKTVSAPSPASKPILRAKTESAPIFGAPKPQPAPAPAKPPRNYHVARLLLFVLVIGAIAALAFVAIQRSNKSSVEPSAVLAVEAPDPVAITQTENAKSREESSKLESTAQPDGSPIDSLPAGPGATKHAENPAPQLAGPNAANSPAAALVISSSPDGASVQIDGQNHDEKTPFSVTGLQPGLHTLVFTKPGFVSLARTFEMTSGGGGTVNVTLSPASTAISFASNPSGGTISIDDEPTGEVTPSTVKVAPGRHTVTVSKDGFEESTGVVSVADMETQRFSVALRPLERETPIRRIFGGAAKDKGMLIVRSRPRGATVRVDDNADGVTTPARIVVHNGNVRLTVEKDGYEPFHRDLQVGKGDVISVDAILERQPR